MNGKFDHVVGARWSAWPLGHPVGMALASKSHKGIAREIHDQCLIAALVRECDRYALDIPVVVVLAKAIVLLKLDDDLTDVLSCKRSVQGTGCLVRQVVVEASLVMALQCDLFNFVTVRVLQGRDR
jgi:hypothetical protein